jgi:hypothetical protein
MGVKIFELFSEFQNLVFKVIFLFQAKLVAIFGVIELQLFAIQFLCPFDFGLFQLVL